MITLTAFLYPLALLFPAWSAPFAPPPRDALPPADVTAHAAPDHPRPEHGLRATDIAAPLRVLDNALRPPPQNQVRIERRVIVRISPGTEAQRERMLAALPRRPIPTRFAEIKHGECISVDEIAAVQPGEENRLLLFLRDRRILAAGLERACNARAFYSGFYIERSEDGKLCIARDRLQSRMGMNCQVASLNRLVAIRD